MDTTTANTIASLANEALSHLETRTRTNGESFIATTDNRPEWIQNLCRRAHGDMMPDATKYEYIRSALYLILENDGDTEAAFDSIEPDMYTADLIAWLASHVERSHYCDRAMEDYGTDSFQNTITLLSMGQSNERRDVMESVIISLEDELSNR